MAYRSAPVPADLFERWTNLAISLGYGQRGRIKLLETLLDIVEALPILFRKRP